MFKSTVLAAALLAASMGAQAALDIQRTTTISDDSGGTAVIESSATIGEDAGTRVADAVFTSFSPRDPQRNVDGSISREVMRDGDLVMVSYDGAVTLSGTGADAQTLAISFTDLRIERGDESVNLTGSLTINGRTIDAARAPQAVRATLLGLLRLFRL